VEFLAKFHLASMVLEEEKGRPLNEEYEFVQGAKEADGSSLLYSLAREGFSNVSKLLRQLVVSFVSKQQINMLIS